MQSIISFLFGLLPGFALGIMISICHLKKHGGEENNKTKKYSCIIVFGGIPTFWFMYELFNLLNGSYHAPDVGLSFGVFTCMVATYIIMIHTNPNATRAKNSD